jgi:hypothetical protein
LDEDESPLSPFTKGGSDEITLSGEVVSFMPLSALAMTLTDAQGNFSFPVSDAGVYYVTYVAVAPQSVYEAYPGKNPATGTPNASKLHADEIQVLLLTGDSSVQNNFALQSPPTSVSVNVYWDSNNDGTYTVGSDTLLSGVVVSLSQNNKQLFAGLTSETQGYLFTNLLAGEYQASYELPYGYIAIASSSQAVRLNVGDTEELFFPVQKKTPYDVMVEKTVDKLTAQPGDLLTYTLTVKNL